MLLLLLFVFSCFILLLLVSLLVIRFLLLQFKLFVYDVSNVEQLWSVTGYLTWVVREWGLQSIYLFANRHFAFVLSLISSERCQVTCRDGYVITEDTPHTWSLYLAQRPPSSTPHILFRLSRGMHSSRKPATSNFVRVRHGSLFTAHLRLFVTPRSSRCRRK